MIAQCDFQDHARCCGQRLCGRAEQFGYKGDNIPATSAWLNGAVGVGVDTHGDALIPHTYNSRVREVNPSASSAQLPVMAFVTTRALGIRHLRRIVLTATDHG
jgi:hypothetical protein